MISIFDLYTIGIGPSSSHTVGPMRAARRFACGLCEHRLLDRTCSVKVELFGSLGLTGRGHGSDRAVILGLAGETPEHVDPASAEPRTQSVVQSHKLNILGSHAVRFDEQHQLLFHRNRTLPGHPNGMRFTAEDASGCEICSHVYYSVGGGFVVNEADVDEDRLATCDVPIPFPFQTATELLGICHDKSMRVSDVVLANECAIRPETEIRNRLVCIWNVMQECVCRGCGTEGTLPGGLGVARRAPTLRQELIERPEQSLRDPLTVLDWVNLYALAVNEENAAGGRIVTAPTNGASGIVPAVLHYYDRFCAASGTEGIVRFLLAAGAVGVLYKLNASISGAEVGCQGEVGVACSMAAAGLTEALGGTPAQVENAAEIAMEHNLGLTCDPVGGLVQIPCIERNAMGSIKALNASRLAMRGDGAHRVSLDTVMATMRQTGADMKKKYKETSQGGLAVNVVAC